MTGKGAIFTTGAEWYIMTSLLRAEQEGTENPGEVLFNRQNGAANLIMPI